MKNIAIYAGTFDPITFGHIDLIERAAPLFERIVVGIAESSQKKTLFSLEERVGLANEVLSHHTNIVVSGFDCLLIEFARQHQANIILRGLRTGTDFDYEFQLAGMNRQLDPKIESMFLVPSVNYMMISSTLVREISSLGGNVSAFVPKNIVEALKEKYKN